MLKQSVVISVFLVKAERFVRAENEGAGVKAPKLLLDLVKRSEEVA